MVSEFSKIRTSFIQGFHGFFLIKVMNWRNFLRIWMLFMSWIMTCMDLGRQLQTIMHHCIGNSNSYFKISPLEGNHLKSADLVIFKPQWSPLWRFQKLTIQSIWQSVTPGGKFISKSSLFFNLEVKRLSAVVAWR